MYILNYTLIHTHTYACITIFTYIYIHTCPICIHAHTCIYIYVYIYIYNYMNKYAHFYLHLFTESWSWILWRQKVDRCHAARLLRIAADSMRGHTQLHYLAIRNQAGKLQNTGSSDPGPNTSIEEYALSHIGIPHAPLSNHKGRTSSSLFTRTQWGSQESLKFSEWPGERKHISRLPGPIPMAPRMIVVYA